MAAAIPHAGRFTSSEYISEHRSKGGGGGGIDGHFNNLNCMSVCAAHLVRAMFRATELQEDYEDEASPQYTMNEG